MLRVALYEPEIPPNTGNIIRLCANTGVALDLIEPLGFELSDRELRRAGLDYHDLANVSVHASYAEYRRTVRDYPIYAFSTKGQKRYSEQTFERSCVLLFGPESRGLPQAIRDELGAANVLRIPMLADQRSLNLSNAVAVAVYEAWRQNSFA
ncbi:MAG: tRNA (cytidine(34)-2'-O)-methyltransferase [Pseudomonadota bacterium]